MYGEILIPACGRTIRGCGNGRAERHSQEEQQEDETAKRLYDASGWNALTLPVKRKRKATLLPAKELLPQTAMSIQAYIILHFCL